jgi:hypothetical protein
LDLYEYLKENTLERKKNAFLSFSVSALRRMGGTSGVEARSRKVGTMLKGRRLLPKWQLDGE